MKTQLFIKEIINEPIKLGNNDFSNDLTGWSGGTGAVVLNNVVYLNAPSAGAEIYQPGIIEEPGHYKVTITITPPMDLSASLQGYAIIDIAGESHNVSSAGTHSFTLTGTAATSNFIIKPSGIYWGGTTFNGGIAEVTIEGISGEFKEIDLYEDINIPITYNIADIKNFVERKTTHSSTIKMPGTQSNNKTFKHIYDINTRTNVFTLNKPMDCYILYDGVSHFDGSFELLKVVDDNGIYYEGLVYTDFGLLFNKIEGHTLRGNSDSINDLNFIEYYQKLSRNNIDNSWDPETPKGSGVVYAPIDKNDKWEMSYSDDTRFSVSELSPCLYIKEIWDKIFEKAGFTYESDFINSDMFKSLVYPFTDSMLTDDYALYEFEADQDNNDPQSSGFSFDKNVATWLVSSDDIIDWISTDYDTDVDYSNGVYTVSETGEYRIRFKGKFVAFLYYPTISGDGPMGLDPGIFFDDPNMPFSSGINLAINNEETYLGGSGTHTHQSYFYIIDNLTGRSDSNLLEYSVEYDEVLFLEEGDEISFRKSNVMYHHTAPDSEINVIVYEDGGVNELNNDLTFCSQAIDYTPTASIKKTTDVVEGTYYDPTQILHKDFKQSDFLMSIIKMFNLYAGPSGNKNFKIEPIKDFYEGDSVDWTDKINKAKPITYQRSSDIIESVLYFKYTAGEDVFNQNYNNAKTYEWGSYHNVLPRNTNEENKFEVIINFAPTVTGPVTRPESSGLVSQIIVPKIYSVNDAGEIEKDKEFKPRILFWNGMKDIAENANGITEYFQLKTLTHGGNFYTFYGMPYFSTLDEPYGNATMDLLFGSPAWHWEGSTWPTGSWTPSDNLYNLYYKDDINFRASDLTKLVTMKINLTKKDIDDLRFSKYIFIKDTYYRLNKISNVVPNEEATIELVNITDSNIIVDIPQPFFPPIHGEIVVASPIKLINDNTDNGNQTIEIIDGTYDISHDDSLININVVDDEDIDDNFNPSSIHMPTAMRIKPATKYKIDIINNAFSSGRFEAATLKDINKE